MKTMETAILSILVVSTLTWAGTLAYLTDTKDASGNYFEAGTLILHMKDFDTDISQEWIMDNMVPGLSDTDGELVLYNDGSVHAKDVEISFDTISTNENLKKYLRIDSMTYAKQQSGNPNDRYELVKEGIPTAKLTSRVTNFDPYKNNGYVDLEDFESIKIDNLPAPLPNKGDSYKYSMDISFDGSATNNCQGGECELILTFGMNQN